MFKLIFLTLVGLLAVWLVWGEGEGRRVSAPETAPIAQATTEDDVAPSASDDVIVEVEQTPERQPLFPGPALRPSPEYAGQEVASVEGEAPEALAGEESGRLYVTGNSVNFRAGPSTSDRVIGALTKGVPVTTLGPAPEGWVNIRDAQGREGFMAASFLSPNQP